MVRITLILSLMICYNLGFSQVWSKDSLVDLNLMNLRMDNDDFQYMCLDDALKTDSLQVYELYITPKYCDYELSIEEITKAICSFRNLRILIVRRIDIYSFPKEIRNLKELQVLYLWEIPLDSLPNEIGELTNLREIHTLSTVNFKKLPNSIGELYNLETLSLDNITELPVSICNLKKLRTITSKSTNVLQEPLISCLKYMTSLKYIEISNDAFISEEIHVIEKDNGDLIKIKN